VQLQVAAVCPDFEAGRYQKAIAATPVTALDTRQAPVLRPLQLRVKGDGPAVVVLQLRFIKMEQNNVLYTSADLARMPCCVIAVCPPHKKQHTPPRRAAKKARNSLQPGIAAPPAKHRQPSHTHSRRRRSTAPA